MSEIFGILYTGINGPKNEERSINRTLFSMINPMYSFSKQTVLIGKYRGR